MSRVLNFARGTRIFSTKDTHGVPKAVDVEQRTTRLFCSCRSRSRWGGGAEGCPRWNALFGGVACGKRPRRSSAPAQHRRGPRKGPAIRCSGNFHFSPAGLRGTGADAGGTACLHVRLRLHGCLLSSATGYRGRCRGNRLPSRSSSSSWLSPVRLSNLTTGILQHRPKTVKWQ